MLIKNPVTLPLCVWTSLTGITLAMVGGAGFLEYKASEGLLDDQTEQVRVHGYKATPGVALMPCVIITC